MGVCSKEDWEGCAAVMPQLLPFLCCLSEELVLADRGRGRHPSSGCRTKSSSQALVTVDFVSS